MTCPYNTRTLEAMCGCTQMRDFPLIGGVPALGSGSVVGKSLRIVARPGLSSVVVAFICSGRLGRVDRTLRRDDMGYSDLDYVLDEKKEAVLLLERWPSRRWS